MIENIVDFLLKSLTTILDVFLYPIDTIIEKFLPDLFSGFTAIGAFFNVIGNGVGWAVSLTGLSASTLALIVSYYIFKLTVPFFLYGLKLIIDWSFKLRK